MGRARGDSVVARFTSFGTSTDGRRGVSPHGVELSNMGTPRSPRAAAKHAVSLALENLGQFPPLQAPSRPTHLMSVMSDVGRRERGRQAPLFAPQLGPPFPESRSKEPLHSDDGVSRHDLIPANRHSHAGTPQHPLQPHSESDIQRLQTELEQAQHRVQMLTQQLAAAQQQRSPQQQQQQQQQQGKGSSKACGTSPHGSPKKANRAIQEAVAEHMTYKSHVNMRMSELHQAASQVLASFHQLGYDVAEGLDDLQGDLDDLETYMREQEQQGGSSSSSSSGAQAAGVAIDAADTDEPPASPLKSIPEDAPAAAAAANGISPGTERMVMLRARREHVENAYLSLVRSSVTGLEALVLRASAALE